MDSQDLRSWINLLEKRVYTGDPLETGGTSIQGLAAPAIQALTKAGKFQGNVLDYGAGKYGRNAKFIREAGFKVWSYDPFNGKAGANGWTEVSKDLPNIQFDVGFTSYVLNVVPEKIEDQIISDVSSKCKVAYHITRNMDIFDSVKKALLRGEPTVKNFFLKEFATPIEQEALENQQLADSTILEFCEFGVQTSRGFQRIPKLEEKGFSLLRKTSGFKVYGK